MFVNQRGAFQKKLTISRNGHSESTCVLKDEFLKKAQNYSLNITSFFINKLPTIFRDETEMLFEIEQHAGGIWGPDFPPHIRRFYPKKCYSVIELVRQIQVFFHRFGVVCYRLGFVGDDNMYFDEHVNNDATFKKTFFNGNGDAVGYDQLPRNGKTVNAALTKNNLLQLEMVVEFSDYFSVNLSRKFKTLLGAVNDEYAVSTLFPNSISHIDQRKSIDVWGTFHTSSKISTLNSKEEREYILCRFPLADGDLFKNKLSFTQDGVEQSNSIILDYPGGLVDLTRGNLQFESNHLLNGVISEINLRLYTRYYENDKFISVPTDCEDAFWSTTLVFSKKI